MNESSINHMSSIVKANIGTETPKAMLLMRVGKRITLRWRHHESRTARDAAATLESGTTGAQGAGIAWDEE